jgi:hypothetical protein
MTLTPWSGVLLEKLVVKQLVKSPPPLWNPKVYYGAHKGLPLLPILSQMNPLRTLSTYFYKIHSIILPSTPRSSKSSLSFRSYDKNSAWICTFITEKSRNNLKLFTVIKSPAARTHELPWIFPSRSR